jgi:hypothetical protein
MPPKRQTYKADARTWKFAFVCPVYFAWEAPEDDIPPSGGAGQGTVLARRSCFSGSQAPRGSLTV